MPTSKKPPKGRRDHTLAVPEQFERTEVNRRHKTGSETKTDELSNVAQNVKRLAFRKKRLKPLPSVRELAAIFEKDDDLLTTAFIRMCKLHGRKADKYGEGGPVVLYNFRVGADRSEDATWLATSVIEEAERQRSKHLKGTHHYSTSKTIIDRYFEMGYRALSEEIGDADVINFPRNVKEHKHKEPENGQGDNLSERLTILLQYVDGRPDRVEAVIKFFESGDYLRPEYAMLSAELTEERLAYIRKRGRDLKAGQRARRPKTLQNG